MLNQSELQEKIDDLFETLDQEILKGVSFDSIAPLVEELKAEYARIKTLKSARGVLSEKAEYLKELDMLVLSVQMVFRIEYNRRKNIPMWAVNTDREESLAFYKQFLSKLSTLTSKQWEFIKIYRKHEVEYYEGLIGKIQELESQRGTKKDYLMLLNIRRSLVSCLCLVGLKCSEVG